MPTLYLTSRKSHYIDEGEELESQGQLLKTQKRKKSYWIDFLKAQRWKKNARGRFLKMQRKNVSLISSMRRAKGK